ncbi:MAG: hypothetical protein AABZ47_17170 [Planctomycetota bacterium]
MKWRVFWVPIVLFSVASAQVSTFEAELFPEDEAWERVGSGRAERELSNGSFVQAISIEGALDGYQKSIADFAGETAFFLEWRVETDATSSILDVHGTPVALSAFGNGNALYHFTFTDQRVQVIRSATLPVVYVDIAPGAVRIMKSHLTCR